MELKDILINYIPYIVAIITFVVSGLKFLADMRYLVKENDTEGIKKNLENLNDLLREVMQENRELKKYNKALLEKVTHIVDYEPEE